MDELEPQPVQMPETTPAEKRIIGLAALGGVGYVVAEAGEAINNRAVELAGKVMGGCAVGMMLAIAYVDSRIHRHRPTSE